MSCNYIKPNIAYTAANDNFIRIETNDGTFFDLDKTAFSFVDYFANKISSQEEYEKISVKEKKILDSLIEKKILLKSDYKKENSQKKITRVVLFDDKLIKAFSKMFGFLFFRPMVCFLIFITLFSINIFYIMSIEYFKFSEVLLKISPLNIGIVFYLFCVSNIFHEFGHALACMEYTGRCKEIGIKFNYIFPAFYCDVSPTLMLTDKQSRGMVGFAGVYFQMLFTASLMLLPENSTILVFQVISLGLIILNLYPFAKTDGYWILCDLMGYKDFFHGVIKAFKSKNMGYKDYLFVALYLCTVLLLTLFIVDGFNYVNALLLESYTDWENIYRSALCFIQLIFLSMLIYEFLTSFRSVSNSKIKLN